MTHPSMQLLHWGGSIQIQANTTPSPTFFVPRYPCGRQLKNEVLLNSLRCVCEGVEHDPKSSRGSMCNLFFSGNIEIKPTPLSCWEET